MMNQLPAQKVDLAVIFNFSEYQEALYSKLAEGLPYDEGDFNDAVVYLSDKMLLPCNNRMARILSIIDPNHFPSEKMLLNVDFAELGLMDAIEEPVFQ